MTHPLTPAEQIELETFRRMLREDLDPKDADEYALLLQSATDAIRFGTMTKEAALEGLIESLVVRLKGARRELTAAQRPTMRAYKLPCPECGGKAGRDCHICSGRGVTLLTPCDPRSSLPPPRAPDDCFIDPRGEIRPILKYGEDGPNGARQYWIGPPREAR